jgi:hypothetical protein
MYAGQSIRAIARRWGEGLALLSGQPVKRLIVAELERRAALQATPQEPFSALDYIHDYIAAGSTMMALADELGTAMKRRVNAGVITTWVHRTPEGRATLAQARALAAHSFAEEALQIVDDADEDKTALLKARLRAEQRMQLASKWNRSVYGVEAPQVNVALNLGALQIDALRQRQIELKAVPMLAPASEGADYEIVPDASNEPAL